MSNFWARTITGLSMVFILLAALFFSGWVFAVIFLFINILGLREFYGLIGSESCQPQKNYGIISGALIYCTTMIICLAMPNTGRSEWYTMLPFIMPVPLVFLSFVIEIYRDRPNPLVNVATPVFGFF